MTLDSDTLHRALHDLAATMPAEPPPSATIHRLARRRRHRQRIVGASTVAVAIAAAGVGSDAWLQSGRSPAPLAPAAEPAPAATPPTPAACPSVSQPTQPGSADPAAPRVEKGAPTGPTAPPSIGQTFAGGGVVATAGTATTITVHIVGGPTDGTTLALAVTADSQILVADPTTGAKQAATGDHLQAGWALKFTATRTGASSYALDQLVASPILPGDAGPSTKAADGAQIPVPPPVGGTVKLRGVVLSTTPSSITVEVLQGNVNGTVTFALKCTLTQSIVGSRLDVVGTRTSATTYEAELFSLSPPGTNP